MKIGKGSIYTRYPNDTFRNGYDNIKWSSRKEDDRATLASDEQWSVIGSIYVDGQRDDEAGSQRDNDNG